MPSPPMSACNYKVVTLKKMTDGSSYKKWVSPSGKSYDSQTKAIDLGNYKPS